MSTQISSKLYLALVASVGLMAENAYALYPETWHVCNKTAEKLNIETLHRHNVRIRIPGSYDDYNTNKFTLDALKCADISTKYDTKPNDQEVSAFRLVVTKAGDTSDVLGVELKSDPSNLSNYSKDATTWTPMYFGARDGWTFLANVEGVHDCTNSKDRFCDSLGKKGTIDVQNFNGGKFRIYPAHYNKTQNLDIVWFKDPKNYNEIDKAILADISDGFDNSNFQSALKNAIGGGPFHFGELGKNSARVIRNEDGSYLTGSKGEPAANLGAYNGIKLCKVYSPLYLADGTTEFNPDPNYKLTNDFQETFGPVELVNEDPKRTIKLRSDGKTTTFTEINTTTLTHGWKVGAEVTTKGTANLIFKKAEVSLKASVEYNGSHATQVSKSVMYSYNIPNQEADVPPRTKYIYTGYYTKAKARGEYKLDYVLTSPTVYADIATAANNFDCAHPTHKRAIIDVSGFAQYLPEKSKLKSLDYNPVTKHVAIYGKGYYEATAATNTSTTSVKVVNLDTGKTVDEHNLSEQPATIK
jgi:hypothetical protein